LSSKFLVNYQAKHRARLLSFIPMNTEDKDDKDALDEDSFFADDYDEEAIGYDLNEDEDEDEFLGKDIFEPDLTKDWDDDDLEEELPFDDELEFEEEDLGTDLELEDEEWQDDELDSQEGDYKQPWPLGLFAAGIIALLLLAAGGYGVLEQRLEMQKEVRLLRATLATTTSNTEVAESRQSQRNLQIHNEELQAQIEVLRAQVTALHEEISQQDTVAPKKPPTLAPPKPKIVKPATVQRVPGEAKVAPTKAPVAQGSAWFVNFGSYKSKTTANSWASKLSVDTGRVAVVSGENKGTLYYRVRVLDLPNKAIAGKIALQLEQTHNLPRLWVGKQ
jgi:cell division septation protein DedD